MKRSLPLILALACVTASARAEEKLKPIKHLIDTHIHFYDTTRDIKMSWPPRDDKVLYKPHLPAEYSKLA